jgi:hypothetical protein
MTAHSQYRAQLDDDFSHVAAVYEVELRGGEVTSTFTGDKRRPPSITFRATAEQFREIERLPHLIGIRKTPSKGQSKAT